MDIDAVAPVLSDSKSAAVEPKEHRVPKWRLDEEIAKKKALQTQLNKALTLIATQKRIIGRLQQELEQKCQTSK